MPGFKTPDFNQRTAAARDARQRALEALRAKPAPDADTVAARQATQAAREAAATERRAARQAEIEEAKAARTARAEANQVPPKPQPTEAELKAARDARYAMRKARKK